MKIFISQPMTGRKESEIMAERKAIIKELVKGNESLELEFADTYDKDYEHKHPLDMLGNCIKILSAADMVVFAPEWEFSKGCKIEHECAVAYGIPCMYVNHIDVPDETPEESTEESKPSIEDVCAFLEALLGGRIDIEALNE